ncbi:MAG TPA: putative Ig domain-containing protein [Streptosporangiaceae bacterium]|nr:putative Ig domain-containing protein [Streptosporangiaceae bacterium]
MPTRTIKRRLRGVRQAAATAGTLAAAGALIALASTGAASAATVTGATPAQTNSACPSASSSTDTSCTYVYTGSEQTFTVPSWVTSVTLSAIGAPGGSLNGSAPGGYGASVTATVPVPAGTTTLYVEVGAPGAPASTLPFGDGGPSPTDSGGGASDVRTCSLSSCTLFFPAGLSACEVDAPAVDCSPDPRLVVAGGGGGSGTSVVGGSAGDPSVTGPGNGTADNTAPGGNGGFGGTAGGAVDASCAAAAASFDGWGGALGEDAQVINGVPRLVLFCPQPLFGAGGGGGGGGYYGGGSGAGDTPAAPRGAGGAGSSYWIPGATDTSMSTDTTGIPEVVISYTLQQQQIAFTSTPPSPAVVGGTYSPAATGGGSGNPVTFSIDSASTDGACSISGGTVSFAGPGMCTVDANQVGDTDYSAAAQVQQSFTIGQAAQAVTFTSTPPSPAVVGGTYIPAATGGGSGNPVTFSIDSASTSGACSISSGTVSFASPGTCTVDANQAGNAGYTAAPQAQQVITVDQVPSFVVASPATTATAGQAYGYTFMASGTPAPSYALSGAPSWLSIDASTGTVSGTVPAGTTSFSYSVTATNAVGTATAGPFTVTVTAASTKADLAAGLSCPASLAVGKTGTCTLTVTNNGPAAAANVFATVALPASLAETSCSTGCAEYGNVVLWRQSSLAAGASVQDTVTVTATRSGLALVLGGAVSSSPDPNPFNNIALTAITLSR